MTHTTRREALESAPARGSGWPGRGQWDEQPGNTGLKLQLGLSQEAPLFTRGSCHGFDARWVPWVLRITVLSLALPILRNPHGLGFADWDFVLDKFEAPRRTILIWGHFVVRADAAGRLDLRIHARGLAAGIGLHVVGAGLLALAWMVRGRQEQSGFVP
ncbi:MAG TPA: hypothetical protein VKF17_06340 [Isosphaeraceae bacterium]|nr:hypothetical protein [Isosphaeraceae bacterium]